MNVGEIQELGPSGCYARRWAVQGRGRNPYTVTIKKNLIKGEPPYDVFGCSCPDWAKHYPRQDCKHIMKIKLEVLAPTQPAPTIMTLTLCAILGRFDGDRQKAAVYCAGMAMDYPSLREEYTAYALILMEGL